MFVSERFVDVLCIRILLIAEPPRREEGRKTLEVRQELAVFLLGSID